MNQPRKFDLRLIEQHREAAGLKKLKLLWAKLEILLGLAVAVLGFRFPIRHPTEAVTAGILAVLGLNLAMPGHCGQIYVAMNRQTAYLLDSNSRQSPLHDD